MRVPLFAARRAIPVALTLSGNEITDATRAAGVQGDGLSGDSSYGLWDAATNLIANGDFETDTTGWAASSITLTRITTDAKFGSACARVNKVAVAGTAEYIQTAFITVTASTAYTASAWVKKVTATNTGALLIAWYDAGSGFLSLSTFYFAAGTHGWTRYTGTATAPGTAAKARVLISTDGVTAGSDYDVYVDGVQLEAKPIATPYVHTDGGTATRSAARVQVPASVLNATQGWVAFRFRMGWGNSAEPNGGSGYPFVFDWRTDVNNRFSLVYLEAVNAFEVEIYEAGGAESKQIVTPVNPGDCVTAIMAWTATNLLLSVNGSAFSALGSRTKFPTMTPLTADIGSPADTINRLNGDVFWFRCGKGTLSNADAVLLHSFGNTDPNPRLIPPSARLTGGWCANNGIMRTYVA